MRKVLKVVALIVTTVLLAAMVTGSAAASDPAIPTTGTPINNDCSAGYVALTFDDGPSENTPALLQTLQSLNLKATFFVLGQNIGYTFGNGPSAITGTQIIQQEVAGGHTVGDHTWDHASITGLATNTQPMSDSQFQTELTSTAQAIQAAGAPYPTLYRPPYGDINSYYDLMARNMGFRVVMSYGTAYDSSAGDGNIIDSQDYDFTTRSVIADRVINGYTKSYTNPTTGVTTVNHWHGLTLPNGAPAAGAIISFHDGAGPEAQGTIDALPAIANAMNQLHLCSTATVRQDATGNIVPVPPPTVPTTGNRVSNPSLEQLPGGAQLGSNASPVCWQQGGYGTNSKTWSLTNDAHSGNIAENLTMTNWVSGDGKLVLTQRQSQTACLAAVTPGKTYSMWVWYKGSWPMAGTPLQGTDSSSTVSIATYYRDTSGNWIYWQGSQASPPTSTYSLAYFTTAPLPANATAISWGLALKGNGTVITDDYTMVPN
jgi:peptidoglycan/xylan/chitin deacetylase (PgdA/CDA1 family)